MSSRDYESAYCTCLFRTKVYLCRSSCLKKFTGPEDIYEKYWNSSLSFSTEKISFRNICWFLKNYMLRGENQKLLALNAFKSCDYLRKIRWWPPEMIALWNVIGSSVVTAYLSSAFDISHKNIKFVNGEQVAADRIIVVTLRDISQRISEFSFMKILHVSWEMWRKLCGKYRTMTLSFDLQANASLFRSYFLL